MSLRPDALSTTSVVPKPNRLHRICGQTRTPNRVGAPGQDATTSFLGTRGRPRPPATERLPAATPPQRRSRHGIYVPPPRLDCLGNSRLGSSSGGILQGYRDDRHARKSRGVMGGNAPYFLQFPPAAPGAHSPDRLRLQAARRRAARRRHCGRPVDASRGWYGVKRSST